MNPLKSWNHWLTYSCYNYGTSIQSISKEMAKRRNIVLKEPLSINEDERKLFQFLLDVNDFVGKGSILRVAGGWVRDKLLGFEKKNKDIDIVLDNMTGVDFSFGLERYQKLNNFQVFTHLGKIKKNPEQSKHLETVTGHFFGISVDIVNLRSESYSEDSRIPIGMKFGTPKEDAFRRDLTINSLFYNLNNGKIEDFTEMGLNDLRNGLIRTPLEPLQTFLDDPLRIIRTVRFAANLNFSLVDDIFEASNVSKVTRGLQEKISRERIGIEMDKILNGPDPVGGLSLLNELSLLPIIFNYSDVDDKIFKLKKEYDHSKVVQFKWNDDQWERGLQRCRKIFPFCHSLKTYTSVLIAVILSPHFESLFQNQTTIGYSSSTSMTIVDGILTADNNINENKMAAQKLISVMDKFILASMKWSNQVATDCEVILISALKFLPTMTKYYNSYYRDTDDETNLSIGNKGISEVTLLKDILEIGLWIREAKELWQLSALLSSLIATEEVEIAEKLIALLKEMHIEELIHMKPLLNGNDLQSLGYNGKIISEIHMKLIHWQVINYRSKLTKEQATQWLLQTFKK